MKYYFTLFHLSIIFAKISYIFQYEFFTSFKFHELNDEMFGVSQLLLAVAYSDS